MQSWSFARRRWVLGTLPLGLLAGVWIGARWLPAAATKSAPESPEQLAQFERAPTDEPAAYRFTPPTKLRRLATEWEPQRALMIGVSLPEIMAARDLADYQLSLLAVAKDFVDVYVFCEHDHTRALAYFMSVINEHPAADAILARTRFIDSRNLVRWTRDYGPVFGAGEKGQLVVLDFIYRNLTRDLEELTHEKPDTLRRFMTLQGDAMPADVAVYLQQRFDADAEVVRPPLWMDGGDFIHDGRGNVFISSQTLVRNGGNKPALTELFRRYFGAERLHVLQALPGSTVNHLDMVFKFVDPTTLILPDFQLDGAEKLNRYRSELAKQVQASLAENEAYVRKHLPDVRILKLPMPPIMFMSQAEILAEAKSDLLRVMAMNRGLVGADELKRLDEAGLAQLQEQTLKLMRSEIGPVDFSSIDGFNAVLRAYGQAPMDKYFDMHSESVTRYRSYLNSLFLHSADGRQAFVVPRFSPRDAAEAERLAAWERQAEAAYRQAKPGAQIHWINCDEMVTDMGFIHCTTVTIPNWPL